MLDSGATMLLLQYSLHLSDSLISGVITGAGAALASYIAVVKANTRSDARIEALAKRADAFALEQRDQWSNINETRSKVDVLSGEFKAKSKGHHV